MKKSITVLFVLALAVCGMAGAFAQSESDFKVKTKGGEVTITGYKGKVADVVIPSTIKGKPVVAIGKEAFEDCTALTSVSVPAGVTSIGDMAFSGCRSLTSVSIPAGVISIGRYAFSGCTGLTTINIPASVTGIGDSAFFGCTGLTSILVDTNNKDYTSRDGVLFSKTADKLIAYPAGKKGQYAIPAGVTRIGESAFSGCTGLTTVSIPASVTSIASSAFMNCTGLTSVSIPVGVTYIRIWAFSGCLGLTSVSIPASVTSIEEEAFAKCTGLSSIQIGANVKFKSNAFSNGFSSYYSKNKKKAGVVYAERHEVELFGAVGVSRMPHLCYTFLMNKERDSV